MKSELLHINSIKLQDESIIQEPNLPSISTPPLTNTSVKTTSNNILFYVIIGILLLILIKI